MLNLIIKDMLKVRVLVTFKDSSKRLIEIVSQDKLSIEEVYCELEGLCPLWFMFNPTTMDLELSSLVYCVSINKPY